MGLWLVTKSVHLLRSILERVISQQIQVTCFASKQFSWSIWQTHGVEYFTFWDLAFKKMTATLYLSTSSESVSNNNCPTCLPRVRVYGKFSYCFSDLCNVFRNILRVRKSILALVNLWYTKNSLRIWSTSFF